MYHSPCGIIATVPLPKLAPISADGTEKYFCTPPLNQPLSKYDLSRATASTKTESVNLIFPVNAWYSASGPEKWFQNTVISHSAAAAQSTLDEPNGTMPMPAASVASASSSDRLVGCFQPFEANSV